jgi:hypothetical protein
MHKLHRRPDNICVNSKPLGTVENTVVNDELAHIVPMQINAFKSDKYMTKYYLF